MAGNIVAGQSFVSSDGKIRVVVVRVGSPSEKARFKIEKLRSEKGTYMIEIYKKLGGGPDRIDYKTDDPKGTDEQELSTDETTDVKIIRVT